MRRLMFPAIAVTACASAPLDNQAIDSLFAEYRRPGGPGAALLVMRDGQVLLRRGYGDATPDTHFRLASVSKQFTAAAILSLGISLDDPAGKYLPTLPQGRVVTVRHLLTHTSGLIDYEDVIPAGTKEQLRDADVLRLLETQTTTYFVPGSRYRYSNSGYVLLALIVEKVSGRSFAAYLRERVFLPAGMKTAVAHEEGVSTVPHRAYGRPKDQSLTSATLGDGGIYASIRDLEQWLRALDGGAFAEAMVGRVDTDDAGVRYGYGWRVADGVISHTGETSGFRNALLRIPDRKLSVVILTNSSRGEPYDIAMRVAGIVTSPPSN